MTHTLTVAGKLPIKTLVAKQLSSKDYEYPTKVLLLGNSQQFTMSAINTFLWVLKIAVKALLSVQVDLDMVVGSLSSIPHPVCAKLHTIGMFTFVLLYCYVNCTQYTTKL